jgi:tRNA pseudouridine55 synthase
LAHRRAVIAQPAPASRRRVDGVLLLDKPSGITSNAALARVKRLYEAEKAGHTGTLDPLASGLLPICFGEATKFAAFLLDASKRYVATIRFGTSTTTQDAEGEVTATRTVAFGREQLLDALARHTGRQAQVPPAHSALKLHGRAYYEYARAGIDIPRAPREIDVRTLALRGWRSPDAIVEVECSKGTYVRTIAADVGEMLGCGAHLAALRRTAIGAFRIEDALGFPELDALDAPARLARLLPIDAPLGAIHRLDVDAEAAVALARGQRPGVAAVAGRYRVYEPDGRFAGIAEVASGQLRAIRLVRTPCGG